MEWLTLHLKLPSWAWGRDWANLLPVIQVSVDLSEPKLFRHSNIVTKMAYNMVFKLSQILDEQKLSI